MPPSRPGLEAAAIIGAHAFAGLRRYLPHAGNGGAVF